MTKVMQLQKTLINGKPHFGIFVGRIKVINNNSYSNEELEFHKFVSEIQKDAEDHLLSIKEISPIFRPKCNIENCCVNATVAAKIIIWGRAFRVMRYLEKKQKETNENE